MPLDYKPERGKAGHGVDVACGTITAIHSKTTNTVRQAIDRRLRPFGNDTPCHRHELLLPPGAPDILLDPDALVSHHEREQIPEQRDLVVIFTVRFESGMAFHHQWELARGFARALSDERHLAIVLAQHQPGKAGWSDKKSHVHMMMFARELHGSNFLGFTPLAKAGAKAILAKAWADWLAGHG